MSAFWLLALSLVHADEGMWLPEQIPAIAAEWTDRGLEIDPAALADPLGQPLGSIVSLGFCSASFVSPDGLIATNHHCVEGYLQYLSDGENNHHQDGFLAASREEEANVGPTARLRIVESITDVTRAVVDGIRRRTKDAARLERIERAKKELVAECESEPNRRCYVTGYFGGSAWRLISTLELQDVRIVYAPPMSIGQFGGDVDNWMWPRHGADFAFIRAYVAPDGTSAPYSADNVPYEPPHHLEVAADGVNPGDFVMIAGYPGRTSRHTLAMDLAWRSSEYLPRRKRLLDDVYGILASHANRDDDAAARLGSSMSGLANSSKNSEGLLEGLSRGGLIERKQTEEAAMLTWVDADRRRRSLRKIYDEMVTRETADQADALADMVVGWATRSADLLGVASTALRAAHERVKPDLERDRGYQERDLPRIAARFERMDRSLHLPSDRDVFAFLLDSYAELPEEAHIPALDTWLEARGGAEAALAELYKEPVLLDNAARQALLTHDVATLEASTDPWVSLAVALETWAGPKRDAEKSDRGANLRLGSAWTAAMRDFHRSQGREMYDDANGTLRLTLGTVEGYSPQDGLVAMPQTTLAGLAAKVGPAPFDAPEALVARTASGPTSEHAYAPLGDVPVNFLSTLDITGGNSGSAVLDGRGRLVGLAFDGNYESIASDWVFVDAVTRCISVDIRFMLWMLQGDERSAWISAELLAD